MFNTILLIFFQLAASATLYIETFLVVELNPSRDFSIPELTPDFLHSVFIETDQIFIDSPLDIRVNLAFITFTHDFSTASYPYALRNIQSYREGIGSLSRDFSIFITSHDFGQNHTSYTYFGGMCDESLSASVVQHYNDSTHLAFSIARAIGNSLGLYDAPGCGCDAAECIMSPTYSGSVDATFSECHITQLNPFYCLLNYPQTFDTEQSCGNGWIEPGEQCDSDSECCSSCILTSECDDASDPCCENCMWKDSGSVCREAVGECDLPDFCTATGECPVRWMLDGSECKSDGSCYAGNCGSNSFQCSYLFENGDTAPSTVFLFNTNGNVDGNCGANSTNCLEEPCEFEACPATDIQCGKIFCIMTGNSDVTAEEANDASLLPFTSAIYHHDHLYFDDFFSVELQGFDSDASFITYVDDGSPCGISGTGICVNQQCTSLTKTCDCPDGVFCDQYGSCHMNFTYSPSTRPSIAPTSLPSKTPIISPSNSPTIVTTAYPTPFNCVDLDDEILLYSGNMFTSCSEFVGNVGQASCFRTTFGFNPLAVCCQSCNSTLTSLHRVDCAAHGYESIPSDFLLFLQRTNFTFLSLDISDILRLCHDNGKFYYQMPDDSMLYDTCVGYGEGTGCDSNEAVCSGGGSRFGSHQQMVENIQLSIMNTFRHPNCPKGCFIHSNYEGLYDFRNCTDDGLYSCEAACLGLGADLDPFVCTGDGSQILYNGNSDYTCVCQDREGFWDLCSDAKADPALCEFYGPGYCPATCGLCTVKQVWDCAPIEQSDLPPSDYYYNTCKESDNRYGAGQSCMIVCLLDSVTDQFYCPSDNVMPNAPLQQSAPGNSRISPSECNVQTDTTTSAQCIDIGLDSLCEAARRNPEVSCVEGSSIVEQCPESCGLCHKHCAPFNASSEVYDISDCSEVLAGESCFVPCVRNTDVVSRLECPLDAQNGDALVGSLRGCWYCQYESFDSEIYEHDCEATPWAGDQCTVSCKNPVLINSETWTCPSELDVINDSIFESGSTLVGVLPDCSYCQGYSHPEMTGCESDLRPGDNCILSCRNGRDSKVIECPESTSLRGANISVSPLPVCDECKPLPNIDELKYDISDCNRTLGAGETCDVQCIGLDISPTLFSCVAGEDNLAGTFPECLSCSGLGNTDDLYDSSECEANIAVGQSCSVKCADDPSKFNNFLCESDGFIRGSYPQCGRCAAPNLNSTIYDFQDCSSLQAGSDCVANCVSSLKKDPQVFTCPANANSTTFPLEGTTPDCFFCDAPKIDPSKFISTCANIKNPGSECEIICKRPGSGPSSSVFRCPADIDGVHQAMEGNLPDCACQPLEYDSATHNATDCDRRMEVGDTCRVECMELDGQGVDFSCDAAGETLTGSLPECISCDPLGNVDTLYNSSECESSLIKGQICNVKCAADPSISQPFSCQSDGSLNGALPNCGRCSPLTLDATIYDIGTCAEDIAAGSECRVSCRSTLKMNSNDFTCSEDANSTAFPLVGTLPDCFFCSSPEVNTDVYISTCATTIQDQGTECEIYCKENVDAVAKFQCPADISGVEVPMIGFLPDCSQPVCKPLDLDPAIYNVGQCGDSIVAGDDCRVSCVSPLKQAFQPFSCPNEPDSSNRTLQGILPDCFFCDRPQINKTTYWTTCSEVQNPGSTCNAICHNGNVVSEFHCPSDISGIHAEMIGTFRDCYGTFTISGSVNGMFEEFTLVLSNNGDEISITQNGAFQFPIEVAYQSSYEITIVSIDDDMRCDISFHSGVVIGPVDNVVVSCQFDGKCSPLSITSEDQRIYSGCESEVRAGDSCTVECIQGAQSVEFTCPTDQYDGILNGNLPECAYCEKMNPEGPSVDTNCTQADLLVGDMCYMRCSKFYRPVGGTHWFYYECQAQSGIEEIHNHGLVCAPEESVQIVVAIFPTIGKIVFSQASRRRLSTDDSGILISVELFGQGIYMWSLHDERDTSCDSDTSVFDPWVSDSCKSGDFTCRFGNISSTHEFHADDLRIVDIKDRKVVLRDISDGEPSDAKCANAADREPETCHPLDSTHISYLTSLGVDTEHASSLCARAYSADSAVSEMYWIAENGEKISSCVVSTTTCDLMSDQERTELLCLDYPGQVCYLNNIINGNAATCTADLDCSPDLDKQADASTSDDTMLFGLDILTSIIIVAAACLLLLILICCLVRSHFQKRRLEHKRATLVKQMGVLPTSPKAPGNNPNLPNAPHHPGLPQNPGSVIEMQHISQSEFPSDAYVRDSFRNEEAFSHTPGMPGPGMLPRASLKRASIKRASVKRQSLRGSRFNLPGVEEAIGHGGGEIPQELESLPRAPAIPVAPQLPHLHTEPPYTPLMPHILSHPDAAKPAPVAPDIKMMDDDEIIGDKKRLPGGLHQFSVDNPQFYAIGSFQPGSVEARHFARNFLNDDEEPVYFVDKTDAKRTPEDFDGDDYSDDEGGFETNVQKKSDPSNLSYSFI